jgi:hypothetical protein
VNWKIRPETSWPSLCDSPFRFRSSRSRRAVGRSSNASAPPRPREPGPPSTPEAPCSPFALAHARESYEVDPSLRTTKAGG